MAGYTKPRAIQKKGMGSPKNAPKALVKPQTNIEFEAQIYALSEMLSDGLAKIGLSLDDATQQKLLDYLVLFAKWNGVYNLSAIRDAQGMMIQHLLDSLSVVPGFKSMAALVASENNAISVLDVGSGGGLPGIPLAICCPAFQVSLVDAVEKKTAFLRQTKGQLKLDNLTVYHDRVENLTDSFDVITSRAFAEIADFVNCSGHLLKPHGVFLAMKGVYPEAEISRLPKGFELEKVVELHVPNLDAQRHLVVIRKTNA